MSNISAACTTVALGSQFFVVFARPWLDFSGLYPPVGKLRRPVVIEGITIKREAG